MAILTWLFDEGTGTTVGDDETDPLDGTLVNSPSWGSNAAGNSVIVGTGAKRVDSAVIDGTKIDTALHGQKQCTIYFACEFNSTNGQSPNFGIDNGSSARALYLRLLDDQLRFYINGSLVALATMSGSGDDVFTVVVDTTQATQTNRVKFYQAGSQLTTVSGPAIDTTFDLSSTSIFVTAHNDNGGDTDVYFASIDSVAEDSSTVATKAAAIAADNDANPDAGAAPTAPPTLFSSGQRDLRNNPAFYNM